MWVFLKKQQEQVFYLIIYVIFISPFRARFLQNDLKRKRLGFKNNDAINIK